MKKILTNKYLITILYIILVRYIWIYFCVYWYSYMGFSYNGASNIDCIPTYIIAILPVYFYKGINRISSFLCVFLYIMAYVPIIIALRLTEDISLADATMYQCTLMVAMLLFFLADRFKLKQFTPIKTQITPFHVLCLTGLLLIYLLIVFRNNLHFSNLANIYDIREENDTVIHAGINGYVLLWTQKTLLPFLFVIYFFKKGKRSLVISLIILAAYIPVFMMNAQKATILTPLFLLGMATLLKYKRAFYPVLIISLSILSFVVLFYSDSLIGFSIGSLLFMRTICICPLLFNMYAVFFESNPYTYYSHIGIVNKITNMYPYDDILGKTVSQDVDNNANAFFWTTDGIAACGLIGIIIISVIFVFFLLFINKLPQRIIANRYLMLMFVPTLTSLLNCSLFTYFFSHGIFLLIILLLIVKFPKELSKDKYS